MFLGRVKGHVVSTMKDPAMHGAKLLIIEPLKVDYDNERFAANGSDAIGRFEVTGRAIVAMDKLGAAVNQLVLITQGSSARMAADCSKVPTDAVVVGIVDEAYIGHGRIHPPQTSKDT